MSTAADPSQSPAPATATETDPETLGWMKGFPPAPDRTVSFQNGSFRSFLRAALGVEQHPPAGADRERLARGGARVGASARRP
ncbi:hypothetical protein ACVWWP_005434 [Bradyrhizobium sp. LM3.6]